MSDFEMKLMDIDSEHLGIPDTAYKAIVQIPSAEFQRICRDLSVLGETCVISATKGGVKFSVSGDEGVGNICLRESKDVDGDGDVSLSIDIEEPIELSFALRYLTFFTKASRPSSNLIKCLYEP